MIDLQSLKDRRNNLCLTFAKKCLGNKKMKHLFPPNNRSHKMSPRNHEHFQVLHANTERLKNGPIIFMQNLLNQEVQKKKEQDYLWNNC